LDCIFCNKEDLEIVLENELTFAIFDKFPVNEGHMLIIPKRHFKNFFDATEDEILSIYDLLHKCKDLLQDKYNLHGFNVGINVGADAGQTIMHLHAHLIPRYKGDVKKPKGGIRNFKTPLVEY